MIVIACPGQGSQKPGFLAPWIEDASARALLERLSEHAGIDLARHGTVSDEATIRDTRIAQPLIVAGSLLAWHALQQHLPEIDAGVAGHSVGEFTAAVIAGVLSDADALSLVAVRGQAMAAAALRADTSMSAVLGGDESEVLAVIDDLGLTPANRNGAGQIVAAGLTADLAALADRAPRGVRVVPLSVAGAFHTAFMESAIPELTRAAETIVPQDPTRALWSNADGALVTSGQSFLESLIAQISRPVRWDACLESFVAAGVTGFIELAPAGALTGIAKRALRGTPVVAVSSPDDLDAAVERIGASRDSAHGTAHG